MSVPHDRIRKLNTSAINPTGEYVLYWMTAFRRTTFNFSLDRAIEHARTLGKPLLILEALRCGYRWANDRIHQFVVEGMIDNARACAAKNISYYPYLEKKDGDGKGLIEALAQQACVIISDDYPCFFLPHMLKSAANKVAVCVEAVDSNGLLPIHLAEKTYARAVDFRRFMQKNLEFHVGSQPKAHPLSRLKLPMLKRLPKAASKRWQAYSEAELEAGLSNLDAFSIDHSVAPLDQPHGGSEQAGKTLNRFTSKLLSNYDELRNHPDENATSTLSPYLHFGHISAHQVFAQLTKDWSVDDATAMPKGQREGWWQLDSNREAYLDQLITWRELGFNMCAREKNYDRYASLPAWAKQTLAEHTKDQRPYLYDLETFRSATTHDPLWNAAQRQLVREGRIHNYLRMLWGKKILEWTPSPQEALEIMIELNDAYALDGRDPNSYSGIFWVLGRYDRAWGPERPVYGKVRYMTSESAARKLRLKDYLTRYS